MSASSQIEDIDPDPAVGVERATILVGPPLILTSAVLACGLAMTVLSSLPSLRLFGWLSAFVLALLTGVITGVTSSEEKLRNALIAGGAVLVILLSKTIAERIAERREAEGRRD